MHLDRIMATAVIASGIAMTACGHVTEAASNPANAPSSLPPQADASAQPCSDAQAAPGQSTIYEDGASQPVASPGYIESMYRPVIITDPPVPEQPVAPASTYMEDPGYQGQPAGDPNYYYDRRHVRHRRSRGRSAAIVVGSAAAGAGIGALAGGGKGAAIGAASGGAAGFIYDRLTHNH